MLTGAYQDYYARVERYVNDELFLRPALRKAGLQQLQNDLNRAQEQAADLATLGTMQVAAKKIVHSAREPRWMRVAMSAGAVYMMYLLLFGFDSLSGTREFAVIRLLILSGIFAVYLLATAKWSQYRVLHGGKVNSSHMLAYFVMLVIVNKVYQYIPRTNAVIMPRWLIIVQLALGAVLVLGYIWRGQVVGKIGATLVFGYTFSVLLVNQIPALHVLMSRGESIVVLVIGFIICASIWVKIWPK